MAVTSRPECYHGGAFFEAIGDEFDQLGRAGDVISADVLDAWFPPSPHVTSAIAEHLPWLLRTSPPTGSEGLVRTIARVRGLADDSVLVGGGSSDLIFLALTRWLDASSRVLILDPMYGEYAHVLERVIGCTVERFGLARDDEYDVDVVALARTIQAGAFDVVILVNPNSPTGRHVPRAQMQWLLEHVPRSTRVWVDETYVEYAGGEQSLEQFAATRDNVIVLKSMSKVYALSGARVGYLCAHESVVDELRSHNPPWAVSLLGQVAGVHALNDLDYYASRWQETHALRRALELDLTQLGFDVVPGTANFVLCHMPPSFPTVERVIADARARKLFLRDVSSMGVQGAAIRIAVKDGATNARMVSVLRELVETRAR